MTRCAEIGASFFDDKRSCEALLGMFQLSESPLKTKKLRITVNNDYKVDFGASRYSDYTKHKDRDRKIRYVKRHLKDLKGGKFTRLTPGLASMIVLWGFPTVAQGFKYLKKQTKERQPIKIDPEIRGKGESYVNRFENLYGTRDAFVTLAIK